MPVRYLGACAGLLLGELTFALAGLALCLRSGLGTIEWRPLAGGALAAGAMGGVLWCARNEGLAMISGAAAIGFVLYVAVCLWTEALHWSEVRQLSNSLAGLLKLQKGADLA